jgi:hypothetical protein
MLTPTQKQFLRASFQAAKSCGGNFSDDDRLISASELLLSLISKTPPPVTGDLIAELKKLRDEVWQC